MHMVANAKRWTLDELHRLPDDGNKYEVVFGELFVTPAPTVAHEEILARLNSVLTPYVDRNGLGAVFHPRAVVRFEGSEAEPDLFVRPLHARLPRRVVSDWDDAPAPLLVVEVLSPVTQRRDLGDKRKLYLAAGTGEYWVIDPRHRHVRVIRPGHDDMLINDTLVWAPSGTPALTIDVPGLLE